MSQAPPSLVSSHVTITPAAALGGRTKRVLDCVDAVHQDGELGLASVAAYNWPSNECGQYDLRTNEIGLNLARDDHEQTLGHELGHLVAIQGFGGGKPVCATAPGLDEWRRAVLASKTHARLARLKIRGRVRVNLAGKRTDYVLDAEDFAELDYLLRWEELWARSYCQFVAIRSGSADMLRQIADEAASDYGQVFTPHWPRGDFAGIEAAIERVMKDRGWM